MTSFIYKECKALNGNRSSLLISNAIKYTSKKMNPVIEITSGMAN